MIENGDKIGFINEMLVKNPQDSYLRFAMAQELLSEGKEDEGIAMLEAITKDDREFVPAYYPLAKMLESKGRTSKAIKYYQRGLVMARKYNVLDVEGRIGEALMILDVYDHAPY